MGPLPRVAPPCFYSSPEWTNQTPIFHCYLKANIVNRHAWKCWSIQLDAICNFTTRCKSILHIAPVMRNKPFGAEQCQTNWPVPSLGPLGYCCKNRQTGQKETISHVFEVYIEINNTERVTSRQNQTKSSGSSAQTPAEPLTATGPPQTDPGGVEPGSSSPYPPARNRASPCCSASCHLAPTLTPRCWEPGSYCRACWRADGQTLLWWNEKFSKGTLVLWNTNAFVYRDCQNKNNIVMVPWSYFKVRLYTMHCMNRGSITKYYRKQGSWPRFGQVPSLLPCN